MITSTRRYMHRCRSSSPLRYAICDRISAFANDESYVCLVGKLLNYLLQSGIKDLLFAMMTAVSIIGNIAAREHVIPPLWPQFPEPHPHELSDTVTNPNNGCSLLSFMAEKDAKWTRIHRDYSTLVTVRDCIRAQLSPKQKKYDYYSHQIPNKHGIVTPFPSVISLPLALLLIHCSFEPADEKIYHLWSGLSQVVV